MPGLAKEMPFQEHLLGLAGSWQPSAWPWAVLPAATALPLPHTAKQRIMAQHRQKYLLTAVMKV